MEQNNNKRGGGAGGGRNTGARGAQDGGRGHYYPRGGRNRGFAQRYGNQPQEQHDGAGGGSGSGAGAGGDQGGGRGDYFPRGGRNRGLAQRYANQPREQHDGGGAGGRQVHRNPTNPTQNSDRSGGNQQGRRWSAGTSGQPLESVAQTQKAFVDETRRGSHSITFVERIADETRPKVDPRTLKILSYNVWFAENIELPIRMRAIGDIIQSHSPDVICLQEVTPNIYAIFQRSNWWKAYKCSLSFEKAITRPYFCMQLSKLPVKSFTCEQFSYSKMGRELCITEASVVGDTPLVVATTHLESPCPAPPKWDQMYSKERVKQANEAVEFLKKNPNVIFCGDMNWDDELDGEFPLPDGWTDAWTELNPKDIGWTYDTKSNPMLSANRKLQKRLDRFLVSLRYFRVRRIEMVGTEPIPEVTYLKQKKGGTELELPVLPSDHFGLLLTMSSQGV